MIVEFLAHFQKDLQKLKQQNILDEVGQVILNAEQANNVSNLKNPKKLRGYKNAYRLRVRDYRIGLFIENNTIEFARIAHRKDIYTLFP